MIEIDCTTFEREVHEAGPALSPGRAGLLFARECAYPDLLPSDYLVQFDDLALAARSYLAAHAGTLNRGLALAEFLFGTVGFAGNQVDYSDPRNSYLNEVLERRLGIPISLSVVFLEVGRRLRLPVAGIGLPGHFIAAVEGEDGPVYLDPFHGGRRLAIADCAELVYASTGSRGVFDMDWLRPAAPGEIVGRMLNNLRGYYIAAEDWPLAVKVMERLRVLQPEESTHVRDLGVLHYRAGAFRRAYDCLNEYLVRTPYASDAESVRQGRDRLMEELARLN